MEKNIRNKIFLSEFLMMAYDYQDKERNNENIHIEE